VGATSLRGVVTDPSGTVVSGAQVTVRNEQTGASQSTTTDARGIYQFYNVPTGNSALFVNSPGCKAFNLSNFFVGAGRSNEIDARLEVGTSNEVFTVTGQAPVLESTSAEVSVRSAISKQHVEAEGKDLGDYFEYNLKQKITVGKNQSALVPILLAHIDAEKVSIWEEGSKEIRRALWITNSKEQTLDAGTFNILDRDAFAGEGVLDTIHPAERRLISYAPDTALRVAMDEESSDKPATHIRIAKGMMCLTHELRESRKYTLHNSDTTQRQVILEHPAREGWKLAPGPKPEETSESLLRFRIGVGPGQTETMQIEEFHPEDAEYELSDLDEKQVALITEQKQVTPCMQDVFHRVLDQKNKVSAREDEVKSLQAEIESINKDQARIRENMKALKGSAEEKALPERYTKQLDSQEDRLSSLNKEIADLQQKQSQEQQKLDDMVQQIALDESF
jgi:Carboxypeptidase regulatory-like domain